MGICSIHTDTSLPLIDQEHIELIVGPDLEGAKDLLEDLIALYTEENEPHLDDLSQVIADNDIEACIKHIHFVAGSSGNMGLSRLCRLCRSLETALRDNSLTPGSEIHTAIQELYTTSVAEFRKLL